MFRRICSLFICIAVIAAVLPVSVIAKDAKAERRVYLHAQGENPQSTPDSSTVYMGETADVYFAVDNPNKGDYDEATGTHTEPQFDLNGYTLQICFDPKFFDFAKTSNPIEYDIPDRTVDTSDKENEELGDDKVDVPDVPQRVGYFVYDQGSDNSYEYLGKTYHTAYITVFYNGGYVPQKKDEQLWYNLARLSLIPKKTGSTEVFVDIESGNEFQLELFAKNTSDQLDDQTFDFSAVNGGHHTIIIKDKYRPAQPVATPATGTYIERVEIKLEQDEGCPIYYTTDGSDPVTSLTRIPYTAPFELTDSTVIKACAYRASDDKYSNVATYSYTILPDRPYLFYDNGAVLAPDIDSKNSKFNVYVSDKKTYQPIDGDSEVYYTFSDIDATNPVIGTDPNTSWVRVSKQNPVIEIDKNCVARLITSKAGNYSEPAWYYFSIMPAPVTANYPSDEYDMKIDVTLSTETADATIYYTTDNTDPKTSPTAREYNDIPITVAKDTTLRAVAYYDGVWGEKTSYYYLIRHYDDYGISAFYPPGVYEGSVNVTLTPNNPDYIIKYHTGDGEWKDYDEVLLVDTDTDIVAKTVELAADGSIKSEGNEYVFNYKIKPLAPEFAPESAQFTNAKEITIYTPESTDKTTGRFDLYYTVDGTDPITSPTRIKAEDASDAATITISKYTVVSAVVLKDKESYSNVVTHSYDIVTLKPVKPFTTLLPGDYIIETGDEPYSTQFMPVPQNTTIYYTVSYDGELCPDPVPNTAGTYKYDGTGNIPVKGNTIIKAVAVNPFGVKSDIGIFAYNVIPEAPIAAPSSATGEDELPVVPVDAVKGSTVKYKAGTVENEFVNEDDERFYIDTKTGNAYRDKDCTIPLGTVSTEENTSPVILEISAELDGVESDTNRYAYSVSDDKTYVAPPYADKDTGIYEERKLDNDNNLLEINLDSINIGAQIKYRLNDGDWETYTAPIRISGDTVLQARCLKNGRYSAVVSYVYNFVPLAPIIELPSGTYLLSDDKTTKIFYDPEIPTNKSYKIYYRANGDTKDFLYQGNERSIRKTMSFKAYVLNTETNKVSPNTIHYYIIETDDALSGSVFIAYPYDVKRISAHLLGTGDYAEGIKLLTQNNEADIWYSYSYTKKADGQTIATNMTEYDINRPIMPTQLMDDITINAHLEKDGELVDGSNKIFVIDFVHLEIPETSLHASGKTEFTKGTKYTLLNDYPDDETIILYYTTDGSDPSDPANTNRKEYSGEELVLDAATTVKAVYFSACGTCKPMDVANCPDGVYGEVGTYRYTIPTTITVGGGGGGRKTIDNTRKYTSDIFTNEHPTHIGYINGYPDGSVQPDGNITREEIAAILYRITNRQYEKPFASTGEYFPDVSEGRWSVKEIEYLTESQVIEGYPDGEFKPEKHLTRAEFCALIYRFTNTEEAESEKIYTDLESDHWAYGTIMSLTQTGFVEGYEDDSFKPENPITRAEAMTVINKILGRKPLESYVKSLNFNPFNDLLEERWYYVTVLEATITHNYWLDKNGYEYKWEDWK